MSIVQLHAVAYFTGWVLLGFSVVLAAIAVASIFIGEPMYALYYGGASLVHLVVGAIIVRVIERPVDISFLDSMAVAILSFLIPGITHTLVMVSCGFGFWDSLFESISGITTTGLSVFSPGDLPKTLLFSRALLQWVGGVGIVILTLGMLLRPGTMSYKLLATHIRKEAVMPSIMVVARAVIMIYIMLTALAVASYRLAGMTWFDSIVHGLTTISTGGFSTLPYLPWPAASVALVFMFVSAQSFPRYYMAVFKRRPRFLGMGPQIKTFIAVNAVAVLLAWSMAAASGLNMSLPDVVFMVLSASTTTGYATIPVDSLPDGVKYLLVILMIIGASLGSTGGGFKQYRLIILVKEVWRRILAAVSPYGRIIHVKIEGAAVGDEEVYSCLLIINLYIIVLAASTLLFMYEGYGLADSLFTVASALGTVGLAPSIVGPGLSWWAKLLLSIDMFLGRLEILPVIALCAYGARALAKRLP